MGINLTNTSQTVNDRVAIVIQDALENTHFSVTTLSKEIDVSRNTIYRWRDKESKKIDEEHLVAISNVLHVSVDWLKYGKGSLSNNPKIDQIETAVNDVSADYKGLDQTVSNVRSKAESLKQDLQSLIDDLDSLKKK